MDAEREFDVVMVAEPEGGYSVFVPDLPSVATQGETIEGARANAQEAIEATWRSCTKTICRSPRCVVTA
jgi:predicted RNase H-like HicB family nuclease